MREFKLIEIIKVIVKWRKFLYLNIIPVIVASIILSLTLPPKYLAQTRIFPVMEYISSETVPSITSRISALIGLPGFATPSDIYKGIITGREIKERVIKKLKLLEHFKTKSMEEALEKLSRNMKVDVSLEGIISIEVVDKDPILAAKIANTFVEELDRFNKESMMTQGKKTRLFLEKRLREAQRELTIAEDSLRSFQEKYKVLNIEEELKSSINVYAELKSKYIAKKIEYDLLLQFANENHPSVVEVRRELEELKKQLQNFETRIDNEGFGAGFSVPFIKLPETSLMLVRLMREVEIKSRVYAFLSEQYERAKILETKDTPTLQIIDRAVPPEKRAWPKRKVMVLLSTIIALMLSIIFIFWLEFSESIEEESDWGKIIDKFKEDFKFFKRGT
jgi:uncharacterized protein involved in exopolysaccharide biosynthesis